MDDARELYRQWLSDLWGGEPGAAERLTSPDFVGHWPDQEVRGAAALAARVAQVRGMFPDLHVAALVGPVVEGDLLAARWCARYSTGDGELTYVGNDLLRLGGRVVVEYWPAGPMQVSDASPTAVDSSRPAGRVSALA